MASAAVSAAAAAAAPRRRLPRASAARRPGAVGLAGGAGSSGRNCDADGWELIAGEDLETQQVIDCHGVWERMQRVRSVLAYTDEAFRPGPRAVDGRDEVEARKDIFKATLSEVAASTGSRAAAAGGDAAEAPLCHCGRPARAGTLRHSRAGAAAAASGRPYWRCAAKLCRFFELADRNSTLAALELRWERLGPPQWTVVGDSGFRPEDLRQGAVGDCWFMSALAVVAERHDLLQKVLPNLNAGLESGCHEVRLCLDGSWTATLVDGFFPMAAPGKQKREDETGLAFGRAAHHQLWVPLVEKAYAKAHGSYSAISGGQVAEAMLDLTGCPTETISFRVPGFDRELFWGRLLSFLSAGFPVGCGTSSETVEELGVVGQHAYSVLEASERPECLLGSSEFILQRMVKVRNPWGEWTRKEYDEVLRSLGVAIAGEGAFWMGYEDFVRAFAVVDVCKAHQGWHARSFDVGFAPGSGTGLRRVLHLRVPQRTECYVMAIQPTERGARVRRPRGYLLNDVSYAVLTAGSGEVEALRLGGARRDVAGESLLLGPEQEHVVVPFSFKARPGSCILRIYSAGPVSARLMETSAEQASSFWAGLHKYVAGPRRDRLGEGLQQRMAHGVLDEGSGALLGRLLVLEGPSLALGILANEQVDSYLSASVLLEANHMVACTVEGVTEGAPRRRPPGAAGARPKAGARPGPAGRRGREAEEDWHEFHVESSVPPRSQQLLFAMVPCIRMHGDYDLSLLELHARSESRSGREVVRGAAAFAPVPLSLPPCAAADAAAAEEADEEAMLLAIAASLEDCQRGGTAAAVAVADEDEGYSDAELELALALSLEEPQAPARPEGRPLRPQGEEGGASASVEGPPQERPGAAAPAPGQPGGGGAPPAAAAAAASGAGPRRTGRWSRHRIGT